MARQTLPTRALLVCGAVAGPMYVTVTMVEALTRDGFDLPLTRAVVDATNIPVIASGGVGLLEHLVDGVLEGGADAVLAASIFHFGEHTVAEAKGVMAAAGLRVRPGP